MQSLILPAVSMRLRWFERQPGMVNTRRRAVRRRELSFSMTPPRVKALSLLAERLVGEWPGDHSVRSRLIPWRPAYP